MFDGTVTGPDSLYLFEALCAAECIVCDVD